jgi:hypothetical protein
MDQFSQDRAPARRRRRRLLVAMLLGSSLATVGAGAMSLAVFTDQASADGSWTTGTIVLGVSPSTVFSATGIMPGDTGTQVVDVQNAGLSQLRYAMTTSVDAQTNGLADQMTLDITDGPVVAGACTGNSVYSGALSGGFIGDPTQGFQAGDRTVNASATDSLCFQWTFPKVSGNSYQDSSAGVTFTFDAEQTANN